MPRELDEQGDAMPVIGRWLRFKRFHSASVAWVLSVGSHDGPRLNISGHRKPRNA